MPVIFLVVSFFIMIAAVGKIYKKIWSRNLDVLLSFQPEPVREGDKGILTEIIKNNKRFPIPLLHVKFVTSKYLRFSEEDSAVVSDLTYKNDIFALMPYQQIKRTLTFECKKRGYFHIDKAEVISSFLFFSDFQYDKRNEDTGIYVYPGTVDIPELNCFLRQVTYSMASRRRLFEDPFSFAGIREYQPFDSLRSINWSASAKVNELMVNVREYTSGQPVVILLNLEPTITWHMDEVLEESIRIAVTAASHFTAAGIPVCLWSTYETGNLPVPELSEAALEAINRKMAVIDLEKHCMPYKDWLENVVLPAYSDKFTYLCISHDERNEMYEATEGFAAFTKELWQIQPYLYDHEMQPHSGRIKVYERAVNWHE